MSDQFEPQHPAVAPDANSEVNFYGGDPSDAPLTAHEYPVSQKYQPPGESGGYKAPGGGMRPSIRERIAAHAPYTAELVQIEEWDLEIEVRSLSLGERNEMLAKAAENDGEADMATLYPEIVCRCSYDPETGDKVFAPDDIAFVNSYPGHIIDKIAIPAMKLSGMGEGAVDEEAKKSSTTESSEPSLRSPDEQEEPSVT